MPPFLWSVKLPIATESKIVKVPKFPMENFRESYIKVGP